MLRSVMWCAPASPYPPNVMTPVSNGRPFANLKPSQVWWWAPPLNEIPPQNWLPPPLSVTPPGVSAFTVIGRVRLANWEPIHSDVDACEWDAETVYVPFATTISSIVL